MKAASPESLPERGVGSSPGYVLRSLVDRLRDRAGTLRAGKPGMDPKAAAELAELEGRVSLSASLDIVLGEIERKKRLSAYGQCLEDTSTKAVTRKSTDLTTRLVTEALRSAFQAELKKLEFTHLAVEIQAAGGARGALYHKLVFSNAPGVPVTNVLSEGESRTLSLAAFLTELSTAPTPSAIIFDDPVSSLDHVWRERIARRLVGEAKTRQVIVFTHDLLFLRRLLDECERGGVDCRHQYVRRDATAAGISSAELPWVAMRVKERIGRLRDKWQQANAIHRKDGPDAYEPIGREIFGMLRETWEQAVSEVLLNEVVERYRDSIETKRLQALHDITKEDCETVENAMSECSRWLRGHDAAAADGTPFPKPDVLKKRIDDLDGWVLGVRKRRS